MKSISIFGFTGSIGTQALNLLQDRNDYSYDFFVCGSNVEEAEKILNKFYLLKSKKFTWEKYL